jgi:hypothetical protein
MSAMAAGSVFDAPRGDYTFVIGTDTGAGGVIMTNTGDLARCFLGIV